MTIRLIGGELRESAKGNTEVAGEFGLSQKNGKWFAHADTLAACTGIFEMAATIRQRRSSLRSLYGAS